MSLDRAKIDSVKAIRISDYFKKVVIPDMGSYFTYPADFAVRDVCQCPLHSEDTPSFRWYPESNSYYCFGCGSGGDIIKLHREYMRINKNTEVGFNEAVKFLSELSDGVAGAIGSNKGGYVPPKVAETVGEKAERVLLDIESPSVDVSRYNRVYRSAWKKLQGVHGGKIEDSDKHYKFIQLDLINTLVAHRKMSAAAGMELIRERMSELGIVV